MAPIETEKEGRFSFTDESPNKGVSPYYVKVTQEGRAYGVVQPHVHRYQMTGRSSD